MIEVIDKLLPTFFESERHDSIMKIVYTNPKSGLFCIVRMHFNLVIVTSIIREEKIKVLFVIPLDTRCLIAEFELLPMEWGTIGRPFGSSKISFFYDLPSH